VPLIDVIAQTSDSCINSLNPLSFEQLGQVNRKTFHLFQTFNSLLFHSIKGYGFIMYKTKLPSTSVDGQVLSIPKLHDRAYIQIGYSSIGVLSRRGPINITINLPSNKNDTLFIIVENMGRLNYGDDLLDNKVCYLPL
jgi:hypothetical protein